MSDARALLERLTGERSDLSRLVCFEVRGDPASKSRARTVRTRDGKMRTYTPAATEAAERTVAWHFRAALRAPFAEPVAIVAIFYRSNFQRIDVDNLMKLVLDAGTKANAWVDDCYVTALAACLEFDRERPRTLIALAPTQSTLDRTGRFTCVACGQRFTKAGRASFARPPRYCSPPCRRVGYERDRATARCAKCETAFHRRKAGQRYCSVTCGRSSPLRRPPQNVRPWPRCTTCGDRVSRREYLRCAACSPKGRRRGSKNRKVA